MVQRTIRDHHRFQTFFGRIDLSLKPEIIDRDTRDINLFLSQLTTDGAIIDEIIRERDGNILYVTVIYSYPKNSGSAAVETIDRLLFMSAEHAVNT